MDNKGWETKEEYKARRTEELNVIRTYECECGKTFKWKSKYYWSNRSGHHKTQTHIKKLKIKEKSIKKMLKMLSVFCQILCLI